MKEIHVLLTRYDDKISKLIYHLTGKGYTHSSIALEDGNIFYSFNYKGFAIESKKIHQNRGVKDSLCFTLHVSDNAYNKIEQSISQFIMHKDLYSYSTIGVIFCLLKIPIRYRKRKYFCSQFVAEVLHASEEFKFNRKHYHMKPNTFIRYLENHPLCLNKTLNEL